MAKQSQRWLSSRDKPEQGRRRKQQRRYEPPFRFLSIKTALAIALYQVQLESGSVPSGPTPQLDLARVPTKSSSKAVVCPQAQPRFWIGPGFKTDPYRLRLPGYWWKPAWHTWPECPGDIWVRAVPRRRDDALAHHQAG